MSDNRKWVGAEVEEGTHRSLCQLATLKGSRPHILAAELLEAGITRELEYLAEKDRDKLPFELRLLAQVRRIAHVQRIRQMIRQVANDHADDPTEEKADLLASFCDEAGVTMEEIEEDLKGLPTIPIAAAYDGKGTAAACEWLVKSVPQGEKVWSVALLQAAQEAGFRPYVVNQARNALRSQGLTSKREGKRWMVQWEGGIDSEN